MTSTPISVNGEDRDIPVDSSLEDVVAELVPGACDDSSAGRPRGVAAALNGSVVARGDWSATRLSGGDAVEIVTAVQGG